MAEIKYEIKEKRRSRHPHRRSYCFAAAYRACDSPVLATDLRLLLRSCLCHPRRLSLLSGRAQSGGVSVYLSAMGADRPCLRGHDPRYRDRHGLQSVSGQHLRLRADKRPCTRSQTCICSLLYSHAL